MPNVIFDWQYANPYLRDHATLIKAIMQQLDPNAAAKGMGHKFRRAKPYKPEVETGLQIDETIAARFNFTT
ncbi:MAG: hypothetical protein DHS20C10_07880 [marine bacterium B5-7]|nr:MAG: hypothetical protein DHS20C10_07880 [marine bacterium B5-7]